MKLIKPSFEIWDQEAGLTGVYKQIERAGRVCYKSEDKIAVGTAQKFVDRMIASKHNAMLEHGTVYLAIPMTTGHSGMSELRYMDNKYSTVTQSTGLSMKDEYHNKCDCWCITTNLRVLVENDWMEDLWYLCEPTEYHEKRVTVKFYTQIAISREYNRHRDNSMAEQSTRYCNFDKDKFGGVSINIPTFAKDLVFDDYTMSKEWMFDTMKVLDDPKREFSAIDYWLLANHVSEYCYLNLVRSGWSAQQARTVLPLDTNTELVHTASVSSWQHFFELRDAASAHPDAYELANPLHEEFIKREYVTV